MLERVAKWFTKRAPAEKTWEQKVAEVYEWRRCGALACETPPQLFDPFFEMPGESWQSEYRPRTKGRDE